MATHKRNPSLLLLLLIAILLGASVGVGCAIQRGERSIVQPLALNKSQFNGTWYYQKTVIDAPYDTPNVFIGSSSRGYKIRWEVTERFLYAFTIQPNVRNADSTLAPVAAWPITTHFTVRHRINYSTGQPSNIIWEDVLDKPWYERPHFRVAWERSVITDFSGSFWIYRLFNLVIQEMPVNVRPEQVHIGKEYMDIVTEELISPGIGSLISKLNQDLPVSSYRIKYRHSFRLVKPSTYTPRPMSDDQFEKFGYFRTAVIQHHMDRGLVDWSYQYFANRHNVATQEDIDAGIKKPKQIVYYLSPDFPESLEDTASLIVQDWNKAFQRALRRPNEQIVVLRKNNDGLPKGQSRKIGDIRYNFLYWVEKPISFGLLGYGPSFADPDTGEIISCSAYIYAGTVERVMDRFMLYYNMVKGKYSDQDLRNGKDYLDIVNNFTNLSPFGKISSPLTSKNGVTIMPPSYKGFDVSKADQFVNSPSFAQQLAHVRNFDRSSIQANLAMIDKKPELKWAMMSDDLLRSLFPNTSPIALRESKDEKTKQLLNSYLNPANMTRLSGIRNIMKESQTLSKHNVMLASYIDPAMSKFIEANANLSEEEILDLMRRMIFRGTESHEIGHTLGLRHNFAASADEENYFPEYFELKEKQDGNTPGNDNDSRHAWFYMYSSIMDYHGEVYGDGVGNGSYDHAAIMYAYGDLLEVPEESDISDLTTYLSEIETAAKSSTLYNGIYKKILVKRNDIERQKGINNEDILRASQPILQVLGAKEDGSTQSILSLTVDDLSGSESIRRIHGLFNVTPPGTRFYSDQTPFVEETTIPLKRKIYQFCSDELVGQNPYCNRFDSGSNPRQIIENMIRRYDGTYPLRNWSRGRRFFQLDSGYLGRLISQFRVISDFYQNWMFRVINESDYDGSPEYYNQLAAISRGVGFVSRVIATPEPGNHQLSADGTTYIPVPEKTNESIDIPVGVGRYLYSRLQQDELGLSSYRFERIGTLYDKYIALMTLAVRDWGLVRNRLDFFYVNFMDYFSRDDVIDIFTGAISGVFNKRFSLTTNDKKIEPNWHPVLQYFSMFMAMTMLNDGFFGNNFTHYMTVAIDGHESGWEPPPNSDVISFSNTTHTRTYSAVQTTDGRSISYKLVALGAKYSKTLNELRGAQDSFNRNQARIEELETELRWIETVLNMMRLYVEVFFEN